MKDKIHIHGYDKEEIDDKVLQLAQNHWKYLEKVLKIHGEKDENLKKIGFHYRTAMIHGYKHGKNNGKKDDKRKKKCSPISFKKEDVLVDKEKYGVSINKKIVDVLKNRCQMMG